MWKKGEFYGVVVKAQDMVPGFKAGYRKFEQQVVLRGLWDFIIQEQKASQSIAKRDGSSKT